MSYKLKPYGALKQCPKCGHVDFKTKYQHEQEMMGSVVIEEGIFVICLNCGYTHEELPLDFKDKI